MNLYQSNYIYHKYFVFITDIVQLSRESAAFLVYMINSGHFAFVADGYLNQMVKSLRQQRMHGELELCGNLMRKQIITVSSLRAFWLQYVHG